MLGRGDVNVVGGFDVRLVKAGEYLHCHCRLELRVEVVFAVNRVGELVQAFTRAAIRHCGVDDQFVCAAAQSQGSPLGGCAVKSCAEVIGDQVEKRLTFVGIEPYRRARGELLGPGHVHLDGVVNIRNQARACLRVITCEVRFHAAQSTARVRNRIRRMVTVGRTQPAYQAHNTARKCKGAAHYGPTDA